MKRKKAFNVVIFIVAIALFLFIVTKVRADAPRFEISNFDELVQAAELSRESGNQNYTFLLTNDIEITENDYNKLENLDFKYISFGSSDYPFEGTFDGQNHTISNLKYSSSNAADTGLFSNTGEGAVIKNLKLENAEIYSSYRGGIVVGYAKGTTFENIIVKDSHLFVTASNNIVTLITDGGIRGGAIVGEAENCILYNCESENTRVNTNSTEGVAALAGKGLYLGGLVGTSISTEVEYSRVIGGLIKNYYDVVVGAVGGNTLYVGGIIGQMKNGSKVIDSFSTAELNYYCATYVAVGAGNSGHVGGIAAAMYGQSNEIIRCHYAGKATSRQYNAVLVVPIIQNNVNVSGIADVFEGGSVVNTYFKPSVNDGVDMKVLGSSNSTSSYGPLTDDRYIDKDYWQTQNYDFYGNIKRQTGYNSNHTNRWVMDTSNSIPIHGRSISASIDFSDAGTVTINNTELVKQEVSTDDATLFAVQGFKIHENTATIKAEENEGYRFVKWFKVPKVTVWTVDEEHEYYDEIFNNNAVYSTEKNLENISFEDNDLYAAYYQARVTFHDINGKFVDKTTGNSVNNYGESDWYDYLDEIPEVEPNTEPSSGTATLIGWTTTKSSEAGGGYSSITSPELIALKNNNTFYESGEKITKTLDLYPVYMDLISNVHTIFEGNEQDSENDVTKRDGVGETSVSMNQDEEVVINVTGTGANNSFPEGYRFLGWYDEDGMRVSKTQEYVLKDVDLSVEHIYTARFEYSIEYYVRAFAQNRGNSFTESELYTTRWQEYNTQFENIPGPGFIREMITHWGTAHVNHGSTDNATDTYSGNIVAPLKVYSHNYNIATGDETGYQVLISMDFPGAGQITDEKVTNGAKVTFTPKSNRYKLLFWTLEGEKHLLKPIEGWTYAKNPMETGTLYTTRTYKAMAMVTTDVNFYKKNNDIVTVTRRYEDNIFMSQDATHTYKYPFYQTSTDVSESTYDSGTISKTITRQASPSKTDMEVDGYVFLGWISSADVLKDGDEWNKIYDVEDDAYCTSDISKAKPYLLDEDELVYETQDIYPVYAKWDITTKTNVKNLGGLYNIPPVPAYTIQESATEKGEGVVTITPNEDTYISGNSGAIYELLELVRVLEDGTEEVIERSNNTFTYNIEAGKKYVFMAKYRPYTVIYHVNDSEARIVIRNHLDVLGEMPAPTYNIGNNDFILIGWTDEAPENGRYHYFQSYSSYENENLTIYNENTVVIKALELWPVYVKVQVEVSSNIDTILEQNNIDLETIRYVTRPSTNQTQINAVTTVLDEYVFSGWYKNYQNNSNKGELLTQNSTYIFENTESVEENTYTAVYKKVLEINYHDISGEIIYTANVDEDESRTFVTQVLDDEENPVEVPVDSGAYEEICNSLAPNEIFKNWQWQKQNGDIVQWDDFYNQNVTASMDLYPIIIRVQATDPEGQNANILAGNDNEKINIYFNEEYENPYISLHIEEIAYDGNGASTTQNIENMEVNLYKSNVSTESPIAGGITDENGNITIELFGEIIVTQEGEEQDEDVFIYQVIDEDNNVVSEINLPMGESKTIKVPYGRYKVKRKKNWGWRYRQTSSEEFGIGNQNSGQEVTFEKDKVTNKWFDSTTYIDNKYK